MTFERIWCKLSYDSQRTCRWGWDVNRIMLWHFDQKTEYAVATKFVPRLMIEHQKETEWMFACNFSNKIMMTKHPCKRLQRQTEVGFTARTLERKFNHHSGIQCQDYAHYFYRFQWSYALQTRVVGRQLSLLDSQFLCQKSDDCSTLASLLPRSGPLWIFVILEI